jgi:IS5 family transposase
MFKGLFDTETRFAKIDRNGDPLRKLDEMVDWSIFLPELASLREKVDPSKGGRPPFASLLKFKMLILQALYNLSDDSLEQQVLDRLSFMRFLGLGMGDDVPDAKTIWAFRESLKERGLVEKLFVRFDDFLNRSGFTAKRGQIVDASIVEVPIRRDRGEVNDKVKQGETIDEWTPAQRAQKDVDARWTRKNDESFFGYKNHICSDVEYKLVRAYEVTAASVHDSNVFESLLRPNPDPSAYGDSAYMSGDRVKTMLSPDSPWLPCLNEKGYIGRPLTAGQRHANRERSRHRARVEHVFGAQCMRAGNLLLRGIGIARAAVKIGLWNLAYNLERFALLASRRRGIVS